MTSIGRPQPNAPVWASPAFLKRSHVLAKDYDPFVDEEFPDNDRRKRTKFGRGSGQWRFTERTPSSEKESETPSLEVTSPSRPPAHDISRAEESQTLVQRAHVTGSLSKASSVANNALIDHNELEVHLEDDISAKNATVEEGKEPSTSLEQVNGVRHVIHGVTTDDKFGNVTTATPRIPHTKTSPGEVKIPGERGENGSSLNRPAIPNSKTAFGDDEAFQESVQVTQGSPSAPIEISSSASSSSAPESDQDYDEKSDQEFDSLFDEQSESGQSNAAVYSGPESDFGLDGSAFSRPPPPRESDPPPSVVHRLGEGLKVDSLNTDDVRDRPSPLQSDLEQIESEAEEPSISEDSAAEVLLSEDEGSGEDIDMLKGHDAAQSRPSGQLPPFDQLGSPEAEYFYDEPIKDLAAAQLLAEIRGSGKVVDSLQDEGGMQRSSSNPRSPSNQLESQGSHEELVFRSQEVPDDEATRELIPGPSSAESPEEQSPSSSRDKENFSGLSEEGDTLETSPEKGLDDSAVRQEPPLTPPTRQKEVVLDATLSRTDPKILLTQSQEIRDHAENEGLLTSRIHQTAVEIIDLESDEEDGGLHALVDEKYFEIAPANEMSAHDISLPLVSRTRDEHQTSTDETARPSILPDSTRLVLKPVEDVPPVDTRNDPQALEDAIELEEVGSRKHSPVARIERHEEELPSTEAPFQRSQEARLKSEDRELPSEKEPRLKQLPITETELEPTIIDELPSIVPDSFEDKMSKSQLLTPTSTQRTDFVPQPSSVSLHSAPEDDTLPTPRLTQGTPAGIVPPEPLALPRERTFLGTPAPPKKTSALIEKLKEMRRLSNQSPKPRSSDASILDPWFAPKRLSQVVRDSEDESEAEDSPEGKAPAGIPKVFGRQLPQTPEKPLAKSFIRSPQENHISSIHSSPQYLPPSQLPPPGFRTNLSYFVPLAALTSHFATTVDILAIALSRTPVTRSSSGPRDYNQTLYITDPSSLALQHSLTAAQIFRPNNRCFPLVEKGDALLLRSFKVQSFQKRPSLLSTESSAWAVFRKGANVQIRGPPVEFEAEERGFARGLWDWWASLSDDTRKRFEDAVPEYKKPNGTAKTAKSKAGGSKSDAPIRKEAIEGLGVDLPGSQNRKRASMKERSLGLDGVDERDMVHESIEAPKRILRARGAKGADGRSESARESRFGTVFTGGLGEPDETQGTAHELRDGKAYRDKRR